MEEPLAKMNMVHQIICRYFPNDHKLKVTIFVVVVPSLFALAFRTASTTSGVLTVRCAPAKSAVHIESFGFKRINVDKSINEMHEQLQPT